MRVWRVRVGGQTRGRLRRRTLVARMVMLELSAVSLGIVRYVPYHYFATVYTETHVEVLVVFL